MIINTTVFVVQEIHRVWFKHMDMDHYAGLSPFALSLSGLAKGYLWQLVTFQFMHAGLWHLLGNLLVIYFFGRAVEDSIGRNGFLKLYFTGGIMGGLFEVLLAAIFPGYFGGPVVGASAGAFGLVAAFATLFPEREITLLLFFVLPISIRARTLLWFSIGLAVFGMVVEQNMSGGAHIANAAHLGGIVTGVVYVYWIVLGRGWRIAWPKSRPPVQRPRELVSAPVPQRAFWQKPKMVEEEELPPAEFISREVDPILDKISAHGIQSLTDRERKILEAARAKMAKR